MALQNMEFYSMNECLRVQMDGTNNCKNCPLYKKDACGGKKILKTGKNSKNITVGENGLVFKNEAKQTQKKRKKKKK